MPKHLWAMFASALCLAAPGMGRADQITFDESVIAGVGNPVASTFLGGSPLTEFYAPLGVHFSGPPSYWSTANGGAILSDDSGFGVSAHSGTNFLAFNRNASYPGVHYSWWWNLPGGTASDPETISFDNPQSSVSIWAAGGWLAHTFEMQAFDSLGNPVGSTDTLTTKGWEQLTVSGSGITSVVLTELGKWGDAWVYDDLSFTADTSAQVSGDPQGSPEPASLALFGVGAGGLGLAGWRRRRRAG